MKKQRKEKLKKVLRAISHNVKDVGYVQGLNQIVGTLIPYELKENEIYWIIIYFLKKLKLKEMYKDDFVRLKILTFQLEIFMQNYTPDLLLYLKQNQISVCYFCTKWFITLFSYDLDNLILLKVWNLFLIKGWKVIIRIALGLLKLFEQEIYSEPIDTLSNYIRNFTQLNQEILNERNLLDMAFSLKVTNRLLLSLQNIFEQHQVYNCSIIDLNILLFKNHQMNNVYDWKILPQAPHFEGQNSTLERLNAHTMVADYINEISTMQVQNQISKHKRSSSITFTSKPVEGIHVSSNNQNLKKNSHQRSLSLSRPTDIAGFNKDPISSNNFIVNNKNGINQRDLNNKLNSLYETEGEEEDIGIFKQISNKIISIFNNDNDKTQKQQIVTRKRKNDIQPIHIINKQPQYLRQSSTPQVFQKNPAQKKYYDQILEDYKEMKDENKDEDISQQQNSIKTEEGTISTQPVYTGCMTDINEFDNDYLNPLQNNAKYMIIQKPNHIEKLNRNKPKQLQLNNDIQQIKKTTLQQQQHSSQPTLSSNNISQIQRDIQQFQSSNLITYNYKINPSPKQPFIDYITNKYSNNFNIPQSQQKNLISQPNSQRQIM